MTRAEFETILQRDPLAEVSECQILEFSPTFYDECLKSTIQES